MATAKTQEVPKIRGLRPRILKKVANVTKRYPFRGSERMLRLLYNPFRRQSDHIETVLSYDASMLIHVDTASYIEWHVFFYGYYERHVVSVIKRLLRPEGIAFDVGANVGCHTLVMSSCVGDGGKVVAVEPHPAIFQRLVSNLRLNSLTNVKPVHCALANESGTATLHAYEEGFANQGMASLYEIDDIWPVFEFPVECRTLDEILEEEAFDRLDLIKVDTEGYELKVLEGARNSLARFRPHIIFEYNLKTWQPAGYGLEDVRSLLQGMNYKLHRIHRSGAINEAGDNLPQACVLLAVPRDKHIDGLA